MTDFDVITTEEFVEQLQGTAALYGSLCRAIVSGKSADRDACRCKFNQFHDKAFIERTMSSRTAST